VGSKLGTALAHATHDGTEVDVEASNINAKISGAANLADRAGGSEECLRGDTAGVQAVATEALPFDEGDPRTEASRPQGAHQAGGPAADDDKVVDTAGLWVLPAGGMDQPIETSVRVLEGQASAIAAR
jgi:hypothetical protein